MQLEHEKCLEIMLHSNAQIEPTRLYNDRQLLASYMYTVHTFSLFGS